MLQQDFSLLPKIACRWIPVLSGPCSFVLIMSAYDSANPVPFWSFGPALYTATVFCHIHTHCSRSSLTWCIKPSPQHNKGRWPCVMCWLWLRRMKRGVMMTDSGGRKTDIRGCMGGKTGLKCWKKTAGVGVRIPAAALLAVWWHKWGQNLIIKHCNGNDKTYPPCSW